MLGLVLAVPLALLQDGPEPAELVLDVAHPEQAVERGELRAHGHGPAPKVFQGQLLRAAVADDAGVLRPGDEGQYGAGVAKVGLGPLRAEALDGGPPDAAAHAQAAGGGGAGDDAVQLGVRKVLELEGVLEVEPPRQARVALAEHLLHLFLVADHDHGNVLPRGAVHQADERVQGLHAAFVAAPARARVHPVRLVDDEDLALAGGDDPGRLLPGLGLVGAPEVGGLLELDTAVAQEPGGLQDPAVELGDGGLARAGVAEEDAVEGHVDGLLAAELAVVVVVGEGDEVGDLLLDRVQANHGVQLLHGV